jgi:mannose-6-phosphate isomerase-like protein (cupin superfamily)
MDDQKQDEQTNVRKAVYILVDEIEAYPMEGCARTRKRDLLTSEYLEVSQTVIKGCGAAENYGIGRLDRMYYVLDGEASLRQGGSNTAVGRDHLLVVPRGTPWGPGLCVKSDPLILLEIAPRVDTRAGVPPSGLDQNALIRVIRPEDVQPYRPAGHAKTVNRCLFENDQVEIIEGSIEIGGGADEHLHHEHEQLLYVLEGSAMPMLIYYPRGVPHGTGGGISVPLKLLVIYSPPLGEARSGRK